MILARPASGALGPVVRALAAMLALVLCLPLNVRAAEEDGGFLNPFPEGDVYHLTVVGDGFAEGILSGLTEAMGTDTRLSLRKTLREFPGFLSQNFDAAVRDLETGLNGEPLNILIVMIGDADRIALKPTGGGRKVAIASPEWLAEYSRRVDLVMKAMKRKNPAVYWVGLPNLASSDAAEHAQKMNEVLRERAYLNGYKFIDTFTSFSDEAGNYSAYGPDLEGKIRVLRQADGEHFTEAGNRKLAHFVEKELRRDLNQAKANRVVPLLGAEAEQAKVNPDNANKALAPSSPAASMAAGMSGMAPGTNGGPTPVVKATKLDGLPSSMGDGSGDQGADNGKVVLRTPGQNGREEVQTIEIVRPPIPASVVSLVARRGGGGQSGDLLVEQIAGGLTLMSSITPSGTKARGKLSPAQAPYFRLLVKGERLTPKPGRADDLAWPAKGASVQDAAPRAVLPPG